MDRESRWRMLFLIETLLYVQKSPWSDTQEKCELICLLQVTWMCKDMVLNESQRLIVVLLDKLLMKV